VEKCRGEGVDERPVGKDVEHLRNQVQRHLRVQAVLSIGV
jgi:hypothetical protein